MKKNIYLAQINYLHGRSTFLPYAAGALIANAKNNKELAEYYCFKEPFFIREKLDDVLLKIDEPFLFGFSNYIWNHEYNKALAKKIKEKFPDCIILFGGHQITPDTKLLEDEDYIDIMCFGEGEEVFENLLLALKSNTSLDNVSNIAYRKSNAIHRTPSKKSDRIDYPSPYLTGVFDSILEHYPEIDFHAVIETNRGCPYSCAYCDWGALKCKVRFFPEEKVMQELQWLSDHGIRGFGCADANFGMFERDEKFVDEMIRLHNEEGILSRFQVSYAKNSNDRVFSISKKLNECGMDKGATLSFQSLSPEVLKNINRTNIPVETFTSLLNKYNEAGIATYSELILGLPGETYESFVEGIDILLNAGQHNSIYIHNCEWLPCSLMGNPDYMEQYSLKYAFIPINESHAMINTKEEIGEFSRLIVESSTMSQQDWMNMNLYATAVQCFHHYGLLILFAIYLHYEKNIEYSDFYIKLLEHIDSTSQTVAGQMYNTLKERICEVIQSKSNLVWTDSRFGNVGWLPEEILFLNIAIEIDDFYSEIKPFLQSFFDDEELFENLFKYQQKIIKLPFRSSITFECKYDFKSYFSNILHGNYIPLKQNSCINFIAEPITYNSWEDYARYVIWYGKKDSRNIYLDEIDVQLLTEEEK